MEIILLTMCHHYIHSCNETKHFINTKIELRERLDHTVCLLLEAMYGTIFFHFYAIVTYMNMSAIQMGQKQNNVFYQR